jgi:hypothetical protein
MCFLELSAEIDGRATARGVLLVRAAARLMKAVRHSGRERYTFILERLSL